MSDAKRAILLNPEVLALNQDSSATAADRLRNESSGAQLWARPLANGDKAVALFNSGQGARHRDEGKGEGQDGAPLNVSVAWPELGWAAEARVRVRDVWARKDLGEHAGGYSVAVAPRDVAVLRLTLVG